MNNKISQQVAITKYDKSRAKGFFVLFKALELFGAFLLTFGFYGLGSVVQKHFPKFCENLLPLSNVNDLSYISLWFVGFMAFLLILFALLSISCFGCVIFTIFKVWIKANWKLAKRFAEDPKDKADRIKKQEIEEKKEQRSKFGYCVGDEAKYICKNPDAWNKERLGQKCKIKDIDEEGDIYPKWEDGTEGGRYSREDPNRVIHKSSFKITKRQKLDGGKK